MKALIISCTIIVGLWIIKPSKKIIVIEDQSDLKESIKRGSEIYADFCVTCHLPSGKGINGTFPPLAGSDFLRDNLEESIRGVKYGQRGKITVNGVTYNGFMARLGLEDDEIADVMNYVTNSWGNKNDKMITKAEVEAIQKNK